MPLIQQRVGRVREKVVKIHQEQGALQAMLAVMVPQVLGQASVMEMQAAAFLAGFVVVDHTGHIQRHQHLFGQNLINLPILNVRRVYWSNLAPFFQGEMGGFAWLPCSIQDLAPALGGAGKQVHFKPLCAGFPPHAVAAFPAIEKHGAVTENFLNRPQGVAAGLSLCLPPCLAASVTRLAALFACHRKVFALRTVVVLVCV